MKKALLIFASTLCVFTTFAQKKTNGTVYIEHPAIKAVADFEAATVSGDSAKIASFLTDGFKSYSGTSSSYTDTGSSKKAFINLALRYSRELDYFALDTYPGSYPDAIEYVKDNKDQEVWVQTWSQLKGVHKETGVKIDAAAHRLYRLTKDNKIKSIINYSNGSLIDEIGNSYGNRTNGIIYNHHDFINTVRKAMYAFEKGDLDKCLSYYSDDARFADINMEYGKSVSKKDIKAVWQKFLNDFEIKSIEVVGYPDYLEYEMNEGREVLSWWKYNLVRKADKKAITVPLHISNSFSKDGKIEAEVLYMSDVLLNAK